MEDEILSIDFNAIYSNEELVLYSPDRAHPPFWYVLMDGITRKLSLDYGIFYYRLIQISILFVILFFSIFFFRKKIPDKFLITFFSLFLTNIYLVHISSQHRMYAMVVGIAAFYSLYWYYVIKNKKIKSFKEFIILGFIAAIGFFINYSMVWLIPVFPLVYLINKKGSKHFKELLVFFVTFLILVGWYIPNFINQASIVYEANINFNLSGIGNLVGNICGILPLTDTNHTNFLLLPYFFFFALLCFWQINNKKNNKQFGLILFSIILFFLIYLLIVLLTGDRLFYNRVLITLVMPIYVLIADSFNDIKFSKKIIYFLIILQLSQFIFYFSQYNKMSRKYDFFNYKINPIGYFRKQSFRASSCLLTIPGWNRLAAQYFLGDRLKIIPIEYFDEENSHKLAGCNYIYILDQVSFDRNLVSYQFEKITKSYELKFIRKHDNQVLYFLLKL